MVDECVDRPRDEAEYEERLRKKDPLFMNVVELKDYLELLMEDVFVEIDPAENGSCPRGIFKRVRLFFRMVELETSLIYQKAKVADAGVRTIMLFLKNRYPDDWGDILDAMGGIVRDVDMEDMCVWPLAEQERVLNGVERVVVSKRDDVDDWMYG